MKNIKERIKEFCEYEDFEYSENYSGRGCRGENVWQLLALFEIRPASYSQVLNDKK